MSDEQRTYRLVRSGDHVYVDDDLGERIAAWSAERGLVELGRQDSLTLSLTCDERTALAIMRLAALGYGSEALLRCFEALREQQTAPPELTDDDLRLLHIDANGCGLPADDPGRREMLLRFGRAVYAAGRGVRAPHTMPRIASGVSEKPC